MVFCLLRDVFRTSQFYKFEGWDNVFSQLSDLHTVSTLVLDGVVGNLVLLLPTAIGTFYFTSWLQKEQGSNNNNDACGATQPQVIASTTGSAMYQFRTRRKKWIRGCRESFYVIIFGDT